MARPRTPIGSYGVVNTAEVAPGVWRARTLHRGPDGKRRQVERVRAGKTAAKAEQALRQALVDMTMPGDVDVKPSTTLAQLADVFLRSKEDANRSARTVDTYAHHIERTIKPRIGDLRVEEATAARIQRFISTVSKEKGAGNAKGCRSVLSGMFGIAVRNDALRANPVAGVERLQRPRVSKAATALPLDEIPRFRAAIREDEELRRLDLTDLLEFMLFTGCRIGEALALRWSRIDLKKGLVTFDATVSRAKGKGLILQEHGKTESSGRTISVPPEVVELLSGRKRQWSFRQVASDLPGELVFPSMTGMLRDTSNTEADWRANRDRLGYPTLKPHGFRKTVATALDVSGLSARAIAEYLGHKHPSMTQDKYMARNAGSVEAAGKLHRMFGVSSESFEATA